MRIEIDYGRGEDEGCFTVFVKREDGWWETRSFQDGRWHVETESTASVIRTIAEAWRQHLQGKKIALWVDGELVAY